MEALEDASLIPRDVGSDLLVLRDIRNEIVHAPIGSDVRIATANARRARQIAKYLDALLRRR
jgi:hypothetical protein